MPLLQKAGNLNPSEKKLLLFLHAFTRCELWEVDLAKENYHISKN